MASPSSNANNQIVLVPDVSRQGNQAAAQPTAAAAAAPPPVQNHQLLIQEDDREYGCRYCIKKFSNKQALGGHQNAHKVERAMEKNEQRYFGSPPAPYHGRFLPSYNHRNNDFLHRSPYSWSFTSHHQGGGGGGPSVIPYSSRAAGGGYYSRMGPYPGRPHYVNIRLANFGPGSASAMRPARGGGGGPINLRNVPAPQHSDLDLSLKL